VLFFDGGVALIFFAVWVFCIIDVITTPEDAVRNLPKLVWLFIVILLADVGSIAWLVAGRNWNTQPADLRYKGNRGRQDSRRLRMNGTNPDDDEEFLRGLRARAEEQRRRAREAQQRDEPSGGDSTST
jgi:hypothetical protein